MVLLKALGTENFFGTLDVGEEHAQASFQMLHNEVQSWAGGAAMLVAERRVVGGELFLG